MISDSDGFITPDGYYEYDPSHIGKDKDLYYIW